MKTSSTSNALNPGSVLVRRGTAVDAARLAELAARVFRETFGPDNRPDDLALHLSLSYGVAQQSAELTDPGITTLLAEVNGELSGYTQLKAGPAPECVTGPAPLEILRFYVDRIWHGSGLAYRLMNATAQEARSGGARTLWLGVWERNPRAIAFYEKSGFVAVGSKVFRVGEDDQNDVVMVKSIQAGLS